MLCSHISNFLFKEITILYNISTCSQQRNWRFTWRSLTLKRRESIIASLCDNDISRWSSDFETRPPDYRLQLHSIGVQKYVQCIINLNEYSSDLNHAFLFNQPYIEIRTTYWTETTDRRKHFFRVVFFLIVKNADRNRLCGRRIQQLNESNKRIQPLNESNHYTILILS